MLYRIHILDVYINYVENVSSSLGHDTIPYAEEMLAVNNKELLHDRWDRIRKTVALERPERTPVVLEYAGFAAHVTGTSMVEFLSSPTKAMETMIQAYHLVGGGDGVNYGTFWPYGLCYSFMAKVRVPGVDLPENAVWQVEETELMRREDYDHILDLGWTEFFESFMRERVLNDVPEERLTRRGKSPDVRGAWSEHGVPVLSGGVVTTPFELLCGGRSLIPFFIDLAEIPDKIEAVMNTIVPHLTAKTIRQARRCGYSVVWIGGWRGAPQLISPAMWNRFVWTYFSRLVHEVLDAGLIALLHLDSDWTRDLERFRELPGGRCIMSLDGETDIFEAKRILGDHMCLMGDVPAAMLYRSKPDEVYNYAARLVRELGPEGFILQSGCDIPTNAGLENVQAMVAAGK